MSRVLGFGPVLLLVSVCSAQEPVAVEAPQQPAAAPDPAVATPVERLLSSVEPYGSLRLRLATVDSDTQMQNGTSRAGLRLRHEVGDGIAAIGQVELGLNLVENNSRLSTSESEGSIVLGESRTDPVSTRLGWAGFDFGEYGTIGLGKQWGVYYDVAGWTDEFNVFGASGLGVFNAGTDGGGVGTGRAERAVIYRVEVDALSFGVQKQFKNLEADGAEGYGASLRYRIADRLTVGVAYNRARLSEAVKTLVGSSDDAQALVAGLQWESDDVQVAVAYARLWDQEVAFLDPANDVYALWGGDGVELYARVRIHGVLHGFGGLNILTPVAAPASLPSGYGVEDYLVGADATFDSKVRVYVEGRISNAVAENGVAQGDAFAVGMRLDF